MAGMTVKKSVAAAALVGVGIWLAVSGLTWKSSANTVEAQPPLPVSVIIPKPRNSYDAKEQFAGQIEALQETQLAFEIAGKINSMLVEEGSSVKAGQPLAILDTLLLQDRLGEAQSNVRRLQADTELAELTEKRQKKLFQDGHTSEQRYDEARLQLESLRANQGQAQSALALLQTQADKSILRAPFDGQVTDRMVDAGSVVNAGAPVVGLVQDGVAMARIGLAPSSIASMRIGASYPIFVDDTRLDATLVAVRPDIDPITRTRDALLKLELPGTIAYGELVELELTRRIPEHGMWVPLSALSEGQKGVWTLYAIDPAAEPAVIRREAVEILYVETDRAFVRGTFDGGLAIIPEGLHRVITGQVVSPVMQTAQSLAESSR